MKRVAIITDSTACIPPGLATSLDLDIVPLFLEFEHVVYEDGMSGDTSAFYETLAAADQPPTTAAPAPGAYADAMLKAGERASSVLTITVSSQFSAMFDAANQGMALAKELAPGLDIRVLDSGGAAMAQGFVAIEAARAAQTGEDFDSVIRRAKELRPRVQLLVALDTLKYLGRSGRVPKLLLWASSPLRVKPIVSFVRGKYRPIALARTTDGAMRRLLQALEQRSESGKLHVCVHHTNAPGQAAELMERVQRSLQPAELFVSEFTQLMGVHTGQGLLGFAFYSEP